MPKNRTSACGRMLEHVLPPNVPADTMQGIIVGSLAIGALTAAIDFTVHYAATYRGMFYWDGRLMDTALMGPFPAYAEPVVIVFGVGQRVRHPCLPGLQYPLQRLLSRPGADFVPTGGGSAK